MKMLKEVMHLFYVGCDIRFDQYHNLETFTRDYFAINIPGKLFYVLPLFMAHAII